MRKTIILLLLAFSLHALAQENVNLGIIPTPQKVELENKGRTCILAKAKVKERWMKWSHSAEGENWSQRYTIVITPKIITISYSSKKGRQYAYLTLNQLRQLHTTIPCCTITDWPAYRYRGWMDDISRGPVPHPAFREKQWRILHGVKYNFCNYYTEHTLYQPEFPDLAPAYAAECTPHPDEVINLQLFAHAEETLRIPFYQNMMDSPANFDPSVEETYEFLQKRIDAAFTRIPHSPFFIINCDETEQLGTGRAKHLVDSLGADQVYVNHINRCCSLINNGHYYRTEGDVKTQEKIPSTPRIAMWGDIVAKNPAMMRQLPKEMIYIMWAYEPIDSFTHLIKPFKEQGNDFWVAASTGHSATMTSTPQRYIKNIANLFRDGYRDGASGAMLTCWDDNGEALFDNSWHAQLWAAEMAWNPLKTNDPEELRQRERLFNENFERLFYGLKASDSTATNKTADLYAVGALMYNDTIGDWYTSAALMEPLLNFNPDNIGEAMGERVEYVRHLTDRISVDSSANPHAHYALQRIDVTATKSHLRLAIFSTLNDTSMYEDCRYYAQDYLESLFNLKREYLRLWDQENGDYERYVVMNRYDALAREVLDLDRHVFVEVKRPEATNSKTASNCPMVTLRTLYNDRPIYYTLDGSEPTKGSTKYQGPFPLERSATIKAISYNEYDEGVITEQHLLSHLGMGATIKLNTPFSTYKSIYSGGGPEALIDGQLGSNSTYADGHWQGYWGDSIDAVIDFGKPTEVHEVTMRFMQNTFDWILAPWDIVIMVSEDGENWTIQVNNPSFNFSPRETGMQLRTCKIDIFQGVTTRYLRVVVPSAGPLPKWHPAPGQPSYLFTDEIIIK